MRRFLTAMAFLLLSTTTATAAEPPESGGYRLVWADEFDKDGSLDEKDWSFEKGFVRNNELQWYQPENAACRGGFLVIEARSTHPMLPLRLFSRVRTG